MRAIGIIAEPGDIDIHHLGWQRFKTAKSKGGKRNGYLKVFMDDHPSASFGIWNTGEKCTWSSGAGVAPMSQEEWDRHRAEIKRKQADRTAAMKEAQANAAERARKIWDRAAQATDDHPYLQKKGIKAHGLRVGKWWGWDAEEGKPYVVCENALLVPMHGLVKSDISSLQAIFPTKVKIHDDERDKTYLSSGERQGVFHVIGKPQEIDGRKVFIVAEGYATAATVHECTGHCVLVAFDTGNLLHASKVIRAKYADAIIVFAADNDWGTVTPVNNPGVTYARKAAAAVGGVVAIPEFQDVDGLPKGGDFNDLHEREGAGAVEAWINCALYPPEHEAEPVHEEYSADQDAHTGEQGGDDDVPTQQPAKAKQTTMADAADEAARVLEREMGFEILGYDHGAYFVFVHSKRQIMEYTRGSFSKACLIEICDLQWWETHFAGPKGGINVDMAINFIIQTAHRRGIYDRARVRAGGAWIDTGRHVFHHGDHLSVDGVPTDVTKIRSRYVYEMTLPLPPPSDSALTDAEGRKLFDIAKMFRWQRDSSAALLAGWTFLSPICGALRWRPHVWLTGPAGNGKSTIMQKYIYPLLGEHACQYAQGNSTESGVRQALGSTSVPVLLDEAERNDERETQRVENMMSLIRQSSSSSDAKTLKGTISGGGMAFHVRSMFCLASIYVGTLRKADVDRMALLTLKTSRGVPEAVTQWEQTSKELHWLERDTDLRGRMLRRVIDNMPTILANVDTFTRAAADKFGNQRDGDQYGAMMGGAWSMQNSGVASEDDARAWLDSFDWSEHVEATEADDSQNALQELMGAFVTVLGTSHTVHNLISFALNEEVEGRSLDARQARTELRQRGIALDGNKFALWNSSSAIKRLLNSTPFATDPGAAFERLPGAEKGTRANRLKFSGQPQYVTRLPLSMIGFGARSIASESEIFP
ncbi:toprim domain-containing protein [Dyella sp. AD56]|uniref:toprim domain-containing protein n=1 Tax=Dyella sp. AD56 TaxID=1528744 RepID=UPI0011AF16A4|nr:toprim domain-containing protein [Dyella sp. AD56]